jgi:hypothetical protein
MHQLKHHDTVAFGGVGLIVGVDFRAEIRAAVEHLRRQELRQVAVVDPEYARRVLLDACPCWEMEHRLGVCPMGHTHRLEDYEAKNTVMKALKKSVIHQMTGQPDPTPLLITHIATGTSADPNDPDETELFVETYRDIPTFLEPTSDTQAQANWYFGPAVANAGANLQEWGIMADTVMLARFLQQFDKVFGKAASGMYTFNAAST